MRIHDGGGGASESETTAESDSETGETNDTVYNFKMNVHTPDNIAPSVATLRGCERATELSNGRLNFEVYYNGNYVAYDDTMMALADGTIDMALIDAMMVASAGLKLNQVYNKVIQTELPDRISISEAYRDLLKEVPELGTEMEAKGVHWVSVMAVDGHNLHTATKDVLVPADVQGMAIDSPGDSVRYFNSINAKANSWDPGESYDAISKNLAQGQVTHWALMKDFGTIDILPHHTIFGLEEGEVTKESPEFETVGGLFAYIEGYAINLELWNSLPEDLKQILNEAFDWAGDEMARINFQDVVDAKTKAIDRGDTFSYVTGDNLQLWWDEGVKEMAEWINECEALGYDGQAAYDKMIALIDAHNKDK